MNNSDNVVWNDLHKGARVPINDTDVEGAPFNLNGSDLSWVEGSINKAVYDTHSIDGTFDVDDLEDAENYYLAFLTLLRYINNDMLYGYQEDARNTIPGDFMSFRGYPTATLSHSLIVAEASTNQPFKIDGTNAVVFGNPYTMFFYSVVSAYKMPYNIEFTVPLTIAGFNVYSNFVYRIAKGSTVITHYRDPNLDEEVNGVDIEYWEPVNNGIYISATAQGITTDIVCTVGTVEVAQAPFYGVLPALEQIVTPAEHNPAIPSPATSIGVSPFKGTPLEGSLDFSTIQLYLARSEKCNELISSEVYPRYQRGGRLYLKDVDTLQVGVKLYSNDTATIDAVRTPDDIGPYFWVSSAYYDFTLKTVWKFTMYLVIDENSIVTYLDYPEAGYLGANCWVEGL